MIDISYESHLKKVFSKFATGVCVVTMLDEEDNPHGMTISSFNTVSLKPPLVLWSIRKESWYAPKFKLTKTFAINVLAYEQRYISDIFSKPIKDKFKNVQSMLSSNRLPLIKDSLAYLECNTKQLIDGGDHIIIIGEVINSNHRHGEPLIFYDGSYSRVVNYEIIAN